MHRILLTDHDQPLTEGVTLRITGEEARHALRVKRLAPGDRLEIADGQGTSAHAEITGSEKLGKGAWAIDVRLSQIRQVGPIHPRVEVYSGVPKGPRLEGMIEALSQAQADAWGPLITDRSVVDPRDAKLARLDRVAEESLKQCGRSHLMEIRSRTFLPDLLARPATPESLVIADASGEPYEATGHEAITILVGPEGGWTEKELEKCRAAGARICTFGSAIMRIETAVVAACAIVRDHEQRHPARAGTPENINAGEGAP